MAVVPYGLENRPARAHIGSAPQGRARPNGNDRSQNRSAGWSGRAHARGYPRSAEGRNHRHRDLRRRGFCSPFRRALTNRFDSRLLFTAAPLWVVGQFNCADFEGRKLTLQEPYSGDGKVRRFDGRFGHHDLRGHLRPVGREIPWDW